MSTNELPGSKAAWQSLVKSMDLELVSLHDGDYTDSASEITMQQFLLLRVLWPSSRDAYEFKPSEWLDTGCLERAKAHLRGGETAGGWVHYMASIGDSTININNWKPSQSLPLRTYSLVRESQLALFEVTQQPISAARPKVQFSPIKTRAQAAQAETARKAAQPSQSIPARPKTPEIFQDQLSSEEDSASLMVSSVELSPHSPVKGLAARRLPAVADEEVVNVALINYLKAIVLHCEEVKAHCSPHRRTFTVNNLARKKVYGARVDGYLRICNNICAIVEVKPFVRYYSQGIANSIKMQEAAQMAAWIHEEPPKQLEAHRKQKKPMNRLLVSQDRHEIYLTWAKFDASYVDFIHGKPSPPSFLEMQEYGPFCVNEKKQMQALSESLLAFAMEQSQ